MTVEQIIFSFVFIFSVALFTKNIKRISRYINLGKDIDRTDNSALRWKTLLRVALGQSKMVTRPIAGFLHILIYVGFVIINIEVIEIIIDGVFGTHRVLSIIGSSYEHFIGFFEILAFLVFVACVFFLTRRNIMRIKRFLSPEMNGWPKTDANLILIFEIVLMFAFLLMNASESLLYDMGNIHYTVQISTPISQILVPLVSGLSESNLVIVERVCWWFHIVGILGFLNYLVVSKHLHIILAFPNTYFSNLNKLGKFTNMSSVSEEVKKMFDPNIDPFAATEGDIVPDRFGAKDVTDLNWVQLMNAYSCTECGRCTSECPANQTGKLLSPRKIMMDVRDRLDVVGRGIDKDGSEFNDGKSLINDYITKEEVWACTSCNACTDACPINIDPLSVIVDLRRYLVMEESAAPMELNNIFSNMENNGAPWQFPANDRINWRDE